MICLWQRAFSKSIKKWRGEDTVTFVANDSQQMQIGLGETRAGEEKEGCAGEEEEEEDLRERRLNPQICIIFLFLYYNRFCFALYLPQFTRMRG